MPTEIEKLTLVTGCDVLVPDHGGDLGALLGRELGAGAGLAAWSATLRSVVLLASAFMLPLRSSRPSAFMLPSRSSRPSAFMLPLLSFAAFGLHVLACPWLVVLRAHALRLLTLHVVFGALVLACRRAPSARTASPSCRTSALSAWRHRDCSAASTAPPCSATARSAARRRRPPSRLMVPCALAKPVPAISAAAATEIIKRLVIEYLLTCCIARADNEEEMRDVPRYSRFHRFCFVQCADERGRIAKLRNKKAGCVQPAF